jgi:DNA-formamidopyrimidine glycosylase
MPEICEIIITVHFLLSKLKNKPINKIKVLSGRYIHQKIDTKLFNNDTPLNIVEINSKGKFIWFKFKNNEKIIYLLNTLGLTGAWSEEKNKSTRIELIYSINKKLYYNDARNFGTLTLTDDINLLNIKLNKLAPDLLKIEFTLKIFKERINNIKNTDKEIVKILMNQDFGKSIGSGIGNYLSAEILYKAKINPARYLSSLSEKEIKNLYNSIKYILKLCYANNKIGYMKLFPEFINKHIKKIKSAHYPNYLPEIDIKNNEFEFNVYQQKEDLYGNIVEIAKIIPGRSTFWVPKIQK